MVTPSSNTCLEPVTYRLLGDRDDITVHFARAPVTRIGLDPPADRQFDPEAITAAGRQLRDADVDIIAWNGTSGSWLGTGRDAELAAALAEAAGAPATTSTLALLDACRVYGVTRLAVATPYTDDVNDRIAATWSAAGVDVTAIRGLGLSDNEAFARVPEETVDEQLRMVALEPGDPHAAAVLCTNVRGAFLADPLERELGVPIFDSVAVSLWQALLMAGLADPLPGHGTIMRDGFVLHAMQGICERLLADTGCDRTTLRADLPGHGLRVSLTAAEALRPGVAPIRRDRSLDQRRLNTVQWLELHRRNLVQPHFHADPQPPQALRDVYGVRAQMLGPVEHAGSMPAWLSVHSLRERPWSGEDIAALDRARAAAARLISAARSALS